jgi:hypothetical protein
VYVSKEDHRVILELVKDPISVMRVDVNVRDALDAIIIATPMSLKTQKPEAESRIA